MKAIGKTIKFFGMILCAAFVFSGNTHASTLFDGRAIHLNVEENRIFKIGVTGTTAGYNFIALIEDAKQESIPLGDLGFWEMVADPPSALRNYDLQLIIRKNYKGKFQIELEYDPKIRDIRYRVLAGEIQVKVDRNDYYPTLIIDSIAPVASVTEVKAVPEDRLYRPGAKRFLFYDFNSFDADLRKYYGKVKRLLKNSDFSHYFYCYESGNYNSYYFRIYRSHDQLDTDKMGLSLENGTLGYYQKIFENLKTLHGTDFADEIYIVSRFGKSYSKELKEYAREIGLSKDMAIILWSYEDIQ